MKRLRLVLVPVLAVASGVPLGLPRPAAALTSLPTARDDSVLGAFQTTCLREEPDYDALNKQAGVDGMTNLGDHSAPGPDGATVRSHRWGGHLPDGPYALYVASVRTKDAVQTSCGVSGPVGDADHFRDGLMHRMGLPPMPTPSLEGDGSSVYVWPDFPLRDHRLILQTKPAKDGTGFVLVTLAVKRVP